MKKLHGIHGARSAVQIVIASFLAALAPLGAGQAWAGNLTVDGDLTVSNKLTAQSITLGDENRTDWPSGGSGGLPLQGYTYVIVAEGTNDTHRGNNLHDAYDTAATLSPTTTNRVAVIVPPGGYNLGTSGLVMNVSCVDLIGLVPCQMTAKQAITDSAGRRRFQTVANVQNTVRIYAAVDGESGTLVQTVDDIRIESMMLSNSSSGSGYYPNLGGNTHTVLRHVAMSGMRSDFQYQGLYIDCVSGEYSFGAGENGHADGTFIDCVGDFGSFGGYGGGAGGTFIGCSGSSYSFGGLGGADGTFIDCVSQDTYSFGGHGGAANGTFRGCIGGGASFGGRNGTAGGTFIDCVGENESFGGDEDPESDPDEDTGARGTFIDCVGGQHSFGGGNTLATTAKLQHCKAGNYSFGGFNTSSDDFNYNVGGMNTFLMLPNLRTSSSGLPSGSVWSSNGVLRVVQ